MTIKSSSIIENKVVTVQKGREIGRVSDVIYDPADNKIAAFMIGSSGLFSNPKLIMFSDIKGIGEDAVLIESGDDLKTTSEVPKTVAAIAKDGTYLTQRDVLTRSGDELGKVSDIYFDTQTGFVSGFEVSQGPKNLLSGRKQIHIDDIITVGENDIIVKDEAEQEIRQQSTQQGVQGTIQNIQQKTPELVGQVQGFVQNTSQNIQSEVQTQVQNPDLQNIPHNISQEAQDIGHKISESAQELKENLLGQAEKDAAGKYLTKNILLPNDKILGKRGEMINYKIISEAKKQGLLDQVLAHSSDKYPEK